MEMDVSAITVTFNSAPYIAACLKSILEQEGVRVEIVVIDNASSDETTKIVRALGASVRLLANQENIGFGRACNQGFAESRGRYLFLLNPDAWLERRDSLARLCRTMEQNPRWGLAGTRVLELDKTSECPPATSYPDQQHVHCDFSQLPGGIAWVLGASMFIRREVFARVGGFDPGFFLTSEETDLCLRIRQLGWEIGHVREVTARHIGMGSECGTDPYITWLRRAPGLYRFWLKYYPSNDVRRLLWKEWFRANFRRQWYATLARLPCADSKAARKHRQYSGISEAAWKFLTANQDKLATGAIRPADAPRRL